MFKLFTLIVCCGTVKSCWNDNGTREWFFKSIIFIIISTIMIIVANLGDFTYPCIFLFLGICTILLLYAHTIDDSDDRNSLFYYHERYIIGKSFSTNHKIIFKFLRIIPVLTIIISLFSIGNLIYESAQTEINDTKVKTYPLVCDPTQGNIYISCLYDGLQIPPSEYMYYYQSEDGEILPDLAPAIRTKIYYTKPGENPHVEITDEFSQSTKLYVPEGSIANMFKLDE